MAAPFFRWRAGVFFSRWRVTPPLHAEEQYQLEKVVKLSRHGVRPPTPGNRQDTEAATARTTWSIADGELSGHGYSAAVNNECWQGEHYRQLGLISAGCPTPDETYAPASSLQRTRAIADALVEGAFPSHGTNYAVIAASHSQ